MKVNKTIVIGIAFILLAGVIFLTDALNPIIRPVTFLFLMGSSKGKDIIFFGLLGLFIILPLLIRRDIDHNRYLKISTIIGAVLLISGILLEILFRMNMGIALNTVFCSMSNGMSSTSILHTHLFKSILGEVLTNIMGPFIQSDINTGVGLYSYVPTFGKFIIILLPILFVTLILGAEKKMWPTYFLYVFFSSCLIIGIIDGGMFATPSYCGIFGIYFVYRNGYYLNRIVGHLLKDEKLLEENELHQPGYRNLNYSELRFLFNRFGIYILVGLVILLRFTIAFAGAEPDYYTVEIADIDDNVDFGDIPITQINNTTYHVDSNYVEIDLINDLKVPLNDSCRYYTVTWNIYSYFGGDLLHSLGEFL